MKTPAFLLTIGLSIALLLLAGGLFFFTIPYRNTIILGLGAVAVSILLIRLGRTHQQLAQLLASLQQLAQGQISQPLDKNPENSGIASINTLYHKLNEAAHVIETLEEAETTHALQYLSADERLGKALLDMKSTLRTYREDETKRHWSTQGLTYFADILRGHSDDMQVFGDQVIRHLVKYLNVNQGGLFVKTEADGETWLELVACYAYEQKKHSEKRLALGQGLVGQCAQEQKMIVLTNLPDQYTIITSGLGEATPSCLVLVPLRWNEEVYGVVELASFHALAEHQLSFLKKVAETIASSLATVQTNRHMHELLQNSQQLTQEFEQLSLVANNTDNSVVIADKEGHIEFVNLGFTKLTGYTTEEVIGRKPGHILQGPDTDPETVKRIRRQLKEGAPFYEEILNYRKTGESYWISLMVNPIKNQDGEIEQFISIQADVTKIKQQTLDYTYKLEAISRSNAIVEFDTQGNIVDANELFLNIGGYQKEDLLHQSYTHLLPEAEVQSSQTQMMWDSLKAGTFFSGEFKQKSKLGKELWLSGTFNPIFDLEDNLQKIMMFAQFTTHEKEKQHDLTGIVHAFTEAVQMFEITPEGKIKKANALFLQRFGYKRREIARMTLTDLMETNTHIPDMKAAFQHQESFQLPFTLMTKSGDPVATQCSFTGIRNLENGLSKVVVVLLET